MNIGSEGGSGSQDFDLNLAPILDCFTVLITFLLASASFLSIGIFDAGIAAGGAETSENQQKPSASISIELVGAQPGAGGQAASPIEARIKIEGKNGSSQTMNTPMEGLSEKLTGLKGSYPDVQGVTLLAQSDVEYKNVIAAMEGIRKTFPAVMLGGF